MRRLALLAALVLVAGCGGTQAEDLTGAVKVPAGYVVFRGEGVSLVHPKGWRVAVRRYPIRTVLEASKPGDRAAGSIFVFLERRPSVRSPRDQLDDLQVVRKAQDARDVVRSVRDVDLSGAKEAVLEVAHLTERGGTRIVQANVEAVTDRDRDASISATVLESRRAGLDAKAVARSFRLG
ncbi:MAG: hypothetical protein ACR2NB_09750 [Solirubrobacteraceae bacterium]